MTLKRHDWLLYGLVLVIGAASLTTIASAAPSLFQEQLFWFLLAGVIIAFCSFVDLRPIVNYWWILIGAYFAGLALLALTLAVAPPIRGVRAWLPFGSFRFQTSELVKVIVLVILAYFFARRHAGIAHLGIVAKSFVYIALPAAFVFAEPDWGSGLVFIALWAGFLLMSGIRVRHLIAGACILAAAAWLSWQFLLAPYQKERIVGFVKPEYDPLGVNYSVIQSKIAIGSAGFWGKGFRQGTQVQLGFLPEAATDFAFAAFIEEWGLLGAAVLVVAFLLLVFRIILLGWRARDNFSKFICLGTALVFLIEFFLNVGSNLGLLPVVGVTFPFFSYGGSSLLTKAILVGMIQSIAVHATF